MILKKFRQLCDTFPTKTALIFKQNDKSILEICWRQIDKTKIFIEQWLTLLIDNEILIAISSEKTSLLPSIILALLYLNKAFYFVDDLNETNVKFKYFLTYSNEFRSNSFYKKSELVLNNSTLFLFENKVFNKEEQLDLKNILCIFETSGTTANKKIVRVSKDSILTNVLQFRDLFEIDISDVILFGTPLTFDPSLIELFLSLLTGATLYIIQKELFLNSNEVFDTIFSTEENTYHITVYQTTPSMFLRYSFSKIQEIFLGERGRFLKILALGGELFPEKLHKLTKIKSNKFRVFNLYGLTEISCWISYLEIFGFDNELNQIGQFFDCETVYEISENNELLIGHEKRICLLNNEKWSDLPKIILRHTGDLIEQNPNKQLIFKGRNDFVIKRFGCKLCLNSLQQKISKILNLSYELIVCVWNTQKSQLILLINLESFQKEHESKIQDKIFLKLLHSLNNSEMINEIFLLHQFPVNKNGKIDRRLLESYYCEFNSLNKTVQEIFLKYFDINSNHNLNKTMYENGFNSFSIIQFTNELMLKFPEESVNDLLTKILQNNITLKQILTLCNQFKCNDVIKTFAENIIKESTFKEKWKHYLHSCIDATPLICSHPKLGPIVIVGSFSYHFVALLLHSGKVLWEKLLDNSIECTATCSSCMKMIYIGTNNGTMYCLTLTEGNIIWSFQTKNKIRSKPCIFNSKLIFGSYDTCIYCLNMLNGTLVWKTCLFGPISADICKDANKIFIGTLNSSVFCLNINDGTIDWEIKLGSPIFSTALVFCNDKNTKSILWTEVDGTLNIFNFMGKKEKSKKLNGNIFGSILNYNNKHFIFGTNNGDLYCLKHDLSIQYVKHFQSGISKKPSLLTPNEIIITLTCGKILMLNTQNGSLLDEYIIDNEIYSEPQIFQSEVIVFGCRDNYLHCIEK